MPSAWAETLRGERIADEAVAAEMRSRIWEISVGCAQIVDLGSFEKCDSAGIDPATIVDDDWACCQALADQLVEAGFRGVLAPSAGYLSHGAMNLTLFGAYTHVEWDFDPPGLSSAIRARVVFDNACPPPGLLADVRQIGDSHRLLDAYLKSR